jgi:DNA repair protein RecO (recombination protein O)
MAEMILRFAKDDTDEELFDVTANALDRVATSDGPSARDAAIAGAWRILAALGFAPSLYDCGECGRAFEPDEAVLFSHSAGGALCETCARLSKVGRKLPAAARATLSGWIAGEHLDAHLGDLDARAHQRLLREFLIEHLSDGKPMRAFDAWETGSWSAA